MLCPTRQWLWISVDAQGHHTPEGYAVVDGICLDITEKKQLELERQRAEQALQESEARFRCIAETVQEGFFDFRCGFWALHLPQPGLYQHYGYFRT
ncbi:MAG: hypothetical protein HC929_05190 [Leptolyngbyaceae cyanobacterium SM2_5_2]|nr:hypothetical protein [Leptolyngbyaceae cyanobacterium SM2_5_2]